MARCSSAIALENKIKTWPKPVLIYVLVNGLNFEGRLIYLFVSLRNAKKYEKKDKKDKGAKEPEEEKDSKPSDTKKPPKTTKKVPSKKRVPDAEEAPAAPAKKKGRK